MSSKKGIWKCWRIFTLGLSWVALLYTAKEQKGIFLGMFLGTFAASTLENMLAGKPKIPGHKANILERGVIRASEVVIGAGERTTKTG